MFAYLFKYIVIGNQSVGKSSMLMRFTDEDFNKECETTVGVEFVSKTIEIEDLPIKLQIWDTAGQEAFQSITRSYYRGTIGCIMVYDVCNRASFEDIGKWLQQAKNYSTTENVIIFLVGNKTDSPNRVVTSEEGERFASDNDLTYYECSAKQGKGVQDVFMKLSVQVLSKVQEGKIDVKDENGGVKLGQYTPEDNKKKKCC